MRFRVLVEGEHGEGREGRERFEGIVGRFVDALKSNGFKSSNIRMEIALKRSEVFEVEAPPTSAEVVIPDWTTPPEEEAIQEALARPEEVSTISDAALRAAIRRLKKELGGNKILSQEEMAERLGVSRYRIRKVLK